VLYKSASFTFPFTFYIGEIRAEAERQMAGEGVSPISDRRAPPTDALQHRCIAESSRRVAECPVSRNAGLPPQWWEMYRRISIFNVCRQAGTDDALYLHCEA